MFSVLIVDDEPLIRDGLKSLIPWSDHGFQVVDTAVDGYDALEKLKKHSIDLMIIDIRMPGMDGIQLIEAIRMTNSNIHFIILSGYADFDYAQKAIRFNVTGYLLKPIDEDELIEILGPLKAKMDKTKEIIQLQSHNLSFHKDNLLKGLLNTEDATEHLDVQSKVEQLKLDWKKFTLVLIKERNSTKPEATPLNSLKEKLETTFEPQKGMVFSTEHYLGILLKESVKTEESQKNLYETISKTANKISIIISISEEFSNIYEVKHAFHETKSLLDQQFFYKENCILKKDSEVFIKGNQPTSIEILHNDFPLQDYSEKIYYAIDIANIEALSERILEAAQVMVNLHFTEEEIKKRFIQLVTNLLSKCSVAKTGLQRVITEVSINVVDIQNQPNFQSLIGYINKIFKEIIGNLDVGDQTVQIKKLVDFIHRNYHQNLKLDTLADLFNYNSAYLGKLFKNYTGNYFNTYLDIVRMENAKALLSQGYKVYQVAEQVGYTNVDYFHNKFKKYIGMSPTTYRKKEKTENAL
ncbi:DNA-binding response regulator [Bacillus sp. AFS076308]|uniref:response regulator transcription factor n=1 Tax=unclassified Bacillus (in: firmicutes) TaxID=185979 RepID=UPI000BF50967|nr:MULTISPECIES: response regulator transcription factor [unclassified Bacillus (in: firmicutes)]PFN98102.1 DNA-binding response regulator [Bacillus sp. AFS076308]PGV50817.1 DNA-binding response regulator [Bacillus sp. AFS037270]